MDYQSAWLFNNVKISTPSDELDFILVSISSSLISEDNSSHIKMLIHIECAKRLTSPYLRFKNHTLLCKQIIQGNSLLDASTIFVVAESECGDESKVDVNLSYFCYKKFKRNKIVIFFCIFAT